LFDQYGSDLLGFVGARLKSHEAEDVVQKTYMQLLQHPNPADIQNPKAYLYKTAINLALNHLRYQRVRSAHLQSDTDPDTLASHTPSPEVSTEDCQQLDRLHSVLAELPPLCRHAFLLNRIDGLTHAEISGRLKISQKTVERYIIRAFDTCYSRLGRTKVKYTQP
jgi:RNA polymerase sigma-70 factor (ECF subfamily)